MNERKEKMKRRVIAIISCIAMIVVCSLSVYAADVKTYCNGVNCSNYYMNNPNVEATIGSASKSISGRTVSASTTTTMSRPNNAYVKAGAVADNGAEYTDWDSAITSISVSVSVPSSARLSSGWSNHTCGAECDGYNPDYSKTNGDCAIMLSGSKNM